MFGELLEEVAHKVVEAVGKGGVPLHECWWVGGIVMKEYVGCEKMISGGLNAYAKEGGLCLWIVNAMKDLFGEASEVLSFLKKEGGAKVVVANGLTDETESGCTFSVWGEESKSLTEWRCLVVGKEG